MRTRTDQKGGEGQGTEDYTGGSAAKFPQSIDEFRRAAEVFTAELAGVKQHLPAPDGGWYPYQTELTLPLIVDLIAPVYDEIRTAISNGPVVDIVCCDVDLALFFARLVCRVDAVDHAPTNFNQLRGVKRLGRTLSPEMAIHDIDLNGPFTLPRPDYGMALFLGTLYHVKNPFYVLETIAACATWCILSTRIAQITPATRTRIESEPLAYLLGPREANNDPTNYWIFSQTGLLKLLERTGWTFASQRRLGCSIDSDPVHAGADERLFLLVKSRMRQPSVCVRTLEGWYGAENSAVRWTSKRFALEATLAEPASAFALYFSVPEDVHGSGPVRISCTISGQPAGEIICEPPETLEFRGCFPFEGRTFRLDFTVESKLQRAGHGRELGICVPLLDELQIYTERLPFRVS